MEKAKAIDHGSDGCNYDMTCWGTELSVEAMDKKFTLLDVESF